MAKPVAGCTVYSPPELYLQEENSFFEETFYFRENCDVIPVRWISSRYSKCEIHMWLSIIKNVIIHVLL